MSDIDQCIHCGRSEMLHCRFAPAKRPPGCVCEPRDWGDPADIPPVCEEYIPEGCRALPDGAAPCNTCEHDRECHRKVSP